MSMELGFDDLLLLLNLPSQIPAGIKPFGTNCIFSQVGFFFASFYPPPFPFAMLPSPPPLLSSSSPSPASSKTKNPGFDLHYLFPFFRLRFIDGNPESQLWTLNELDQCQASIGHFSARRQIGSSVDGSYSSLLMFEKLPDVNQESSQWTDCEIRDAINLIYLNLSKLDVYLSLLVAKHQNPRKMTLHLMRYTIGFVGISMFSAWLIGHSRLAGSSNNRSSHGDKADSLFIYLFGPV